MTRVKRHRRRIPPRLLAMALVLLGGALVVLGVGFVSVPVATIIAGSGLVALGLFGVEVK